MNGDVTRKGLGAGGESSQFRVNRITKCGFLNDDGLEYDMDI